MSGYDKYNSSITRIAQRMGVFNPLHPPMYHPGDINPTEPLINNYDIDKDIDGLDMAHIRFHAQGGHLQQERMIFDKRRSLDRALFYSYQGANVRKIASVDKPDDNKKYPVVRALINPDKTKQDYDDKIISINWEHHYQAGDVFEWLGTKTRWMIYLQELTELAYFRAEIRKCQYEIQFEDEDGLHTTYAAIRGPVETKIDYIQKHGISVDNPNYSLNILMPKNEATLKYFRRYAKFYLQPLEPGAQQVCWRVEAIDWVGLDGILEINAVEYYANETEDDTEQGIVGALIVKPESPNTDSVEASIEGETFIKPKKDYEYSYVSTIKKFDWSIKEKDRPVKLILDPDNPYKVTVRWTIPQSGQFTLVYGELEKIIVVESLF